MRAVHHGYTRQKSVKNAPTREKHRQTSASLKSALRYKGVMWMKTSKMPEHGQRERRTRNVPCAQYSQKIRTPANKMVGTSNEVPSTIWNKQTKVTVLWFCLRCSAQLKEQRSRLVLRNIKRSALQEEERAKSVRKLRDARRESA